MTARLDDLAAQRELEEAQRRYAFAPRGLKTKRLAELQAVTRRLLKRDVGRKGRKRAA
jgi:hypothetical protein